MDMKKSGALVAVLGGLFFAQTASAVDGTISIQGQITDVTCAISVDGGSNNATVTLPTVSATALPVAGATAGSTPFTIALTGCTGATMNNAYAHFELGSMVDTVTGHLNNVTGTASNVQVQLLDKFLNPISIGSATQGGAAVEDISSGSATLDYAARYYATGVTTSGTVGTQVEYSIVYD